MKLASHIIISTSVSTILYLIFHSYIVALSSLLFGIFIDIDHLFEYFNEYGFNLNVKRFFYVAEGYAFKKTFLILHSWELLLIFSFVILFTPVSEVLCGVFVAYIVHLVFDQIGNLSRPLSYSFIYRWSNNFATEKIWRIDLLDCRQSI
ncbi:MAG: hypothetical protein PHE88_01075 [Elusimicrobia bacterium]|nr:hypothetical protein [Elusimicrobiota bacterium]